MAGIDRTDAATRIQQTDPTTYFANKDSKECAWEVWGLIEAYYNEMRRTGRLALYRNSYLNFYSGWIYRASMFKSGEMGELTRSFWNHERDLLLRIHTLTTQNKLAYKPQVSNSNANASIKREFSEGLLNHITNSAEYDAQKVIDQAVEDCLVFGESSIVRLWNRFKGKPMVQDPETGVMYHEGDLEIWNVTPLDQIFNTTLQDRNNLQWRVIRKWVNKYDLAAQYPNLRDDITALNNVESTYGMKLVSLIKHDDYTIPIFYFFHEPTAAIPEGRMMVLCDPDTVLEDGPLTEFYDRIPVDDMIVKTMNGTPFGYTVAFDLIPLQQGLNELVSAVTTNNINFATQCVIGPKGANLHYQSLSSGMSYLEYDPKMGPNGKPEALNLTHSAPETYQLIDKLIQNMETLANVSPMMRGQPDANATSGQYAALITTQSVIFNAPIQKAYARLAKSFADGCLKTLKNNMVGKKVVTIVGSNLEPHLREFLSDDLEGIDGVDVQLTNPMLQTPAGKMQLADNLMKTGLIKDPQQYIGVYTDGDLPQLYHRQESQLQLVKQENELLLKGMDIPPCAPTDNHVMHILEHTPVIDSLDVRVRQPEILQKALQHIQSHIEQLTGNPQHGPLNPVLAGILGDPVVPPGVPGGIDLPPVGMGVPHNQTGGTNPQPQKPTQNKGPAGSPAAPAQTLPQTGMSGPQPGGPVQPGV